MRVEGNDFFASPTFAVEDSFSTRVTGGWGGDIVGGMLVNVSASDPLTFASAAAFLGLVAALASYLPALRAVRVDPVVSLRNE